MWNIIKTWTSGLTGYLLGHVLPAMFMLLIGAIVIRVILQLISKALKNSKLEKAAHTLIRSVIRSTLYVLLLLTVASTLGVDITGVVALASVLTLAVSLALQNALTNVVGGFTLLSNKPFVSGDFVEIAGQSGVVREIGLTYTKLTTADNKTISIPNSSVVSAQIVNYTTAGTRRVEIKVSASYDDPVEKVLEALKTAGIVPTSLEEKPPFSAVASYDDSAICYLLQVWCKSSDYWTTTCEVNKRVKEVFDQQGISMTYPHLNVHIDK